MHWGLDRKANQPGIPHLSSCFLCIASVYAQSGLLRVGQRDAPHALLCEYFVESLQ